MIAPLRRLTLAATLTLGLTLALPTVLVVPASAAAKDPAAGWGDAFSKGVTALGAKDFKTAETELLKAFELANTMVATDPRHKKTLEALVKLWMFQREWSAAEPWLEKIVAVDEEVHGKDHLELAYSLSRLATNRLMLSKFDKAEEAFRRALDILTAKKGIDDPGVAKLMNNLAETYRRWKRMDKAEALYKGALEQKTKAHGPDHPSLASSLNDLGLVYNQQKKFAEARPLLARAVKLATQLGPQHMTLGRCRHNMADALVGLGKFAEAEPLYGSAVAIAQAQKPVDRPGLGNTLNNLGNLYQQTNRLDEAVAAYRHAVEIRTAEYGAKHASVQRANLNLAVALDRQGKAGEAAAIRGKYGK
jgi:tetratricopeptide (TPR) repeat protein